MHIERGLHFSCSLRFEIRVYKQHDPLFILLSLRSFFIPFSHSPSRSPIARNSIQYFNMQERTQWNDLEIALNADDCKNRRKLHFTVVCNANNNTYHFINLTYKSHEEVLNFNYLFILCFVCAVFFYLVSFGLFAFENVVVLALFHFEAHLEQF